MVVYFVVFLLKFLSSLNFLDFSLHVGRFHIGDFTVINDADAACLFGDDKNDAVVGL